ncbi:MAG: YjfB family protein [Butyrivibrio sp.]
MDIASLSMSMSASSLMNEVSMQVLDMSLDNMQELGDGMRKMLEMSVNPNVGSNIDISL